MTMGETVEALAPIGLDVTCPRFQYHVKLSRVRFPSRRRQ